MTSADDDAATHTSQLVALVERLVQESGDRAGFDAAAWVEVFLDAPSGALGRRRPREFMDTAGGRSTVTTLIQQMQSGAYA